MTMTVHRHIAVSMRPLRGTASKPRLEELRGLHPRRRRVRCRALKFCQPVVVIQDRTVTDTHSMAKRRVHTPRSKLELLPIPSEMRSAWMLEEHVSLGAIYRGRGSRHLLGRMARVLVISNDLAGRGYGKDSHSILSAAQDAITLLDKRGQASGDWSAHAVQEWAPIACLLSHYDHQLAHAPRFAVIDVVRRHMGDIPANTAEVEMSVETLPLALAA